MARKSLQAAASALIEAKTGQTLAELVQDERALKASWESIARRINRLTGGTVNVTGTTVRNWLEEVAA